MSVLIRGVIRWLEIDRAVSYGVAASIAQLAAAPITVVFIAAHLTPEMQGFYYAFASLLALQTYAELGLATVITNTASHEWAKLRLDPDGRIVGDPDALSRLVSLGRFVFKWYAVAAALFVVLIGVGGHAFLSQESAGGIAWERPWLALAVLSGLLLWSLPFNALLEGCDQVANIQRARLTQMVMRYGVLWATLALGGHLWAAAAAIAGALAREFYLFAFQYRRFFRTFLAPPSGTRIRWRAEIFPMQWRLAASGSLSYLLFNVFTPVMFHYHGAVVAGQMGMTMSMVLAIQGFTNKWLPPKVPKFGMLIARGAYGELDRLWWRTTRATVLVAASLAVSLWMLILGLNILGFDLASRVLGPSPTAFLLAGSVFVAAGFCESVYLRAHKQEPIVALSVVTALLMGTLVWVLGGWLGAVGAAAAYLIVMGGVSFPWETFIWSRKRAEWHAADAPALGLSLSAAQG